MSGRVCGRARDGGRLATGLTGMEFAECPGLAAGCAVCWPGFCWGESVCLFRWWLIVVFSCRLYPTSNPKVSAGSGLHLHGRAGACRALVPDCTLCLQLRGLPHPARAGLLPAEQSTLWPAELWRLWAVHGHFRLWPEQLWLLVRTDT